MRMRSAPVILASAGLLLGMPVAAAGSGRPAWRTGASPAVAVSWGSAHQLFDLGTEGLNSFGLHCFTEASCVAWANGVGGTQADPLAYLYTRTKVGGVWGNVQVQPWMDGLAGGNADYGTLDCSDAEDCVAYGQTVVSGQQSPYVATETAGAWSTPSKVPELAGLSGIGSHLLLACTLDATCSGGGEANLKNGRNEAFLVDEIAGVWSAAFEVPGLAALQKHDQTAAVTSIKCASAGNCLAAGLYQGAPLPITEPFVDQETDGRWAGADGMRWVVSMNTGGHAQILATSCPAAGWCSLVGYLTQARSTLRYFVMSERDGRWGQPVMLSGIPAFRPFAAGPVAKISCSSKRQCDVLALATLSSTVGLAYVVNVSDGRATEQVQLRDPVTRRLGRGFVVPEGLSCLTADSCRVALDYDHGVNRVAVAAETAGAWLVPRQLATIESLDPSGPTSVTGMQCPSASSCVLVGTATHSSSEYVFATG